jgi:hypothetical protein
VTLRGLSPQSPLLGCRDSRIRARAQDLQEFTLAFKHGLGQAQKSGLITPDLKHVSSV